MAALNGDEFEFQLNLNGSSTSSLARLCAQTVGELSGAQTTGHSGARLLTESVAPREEVRQWKRKWFPVASGGLSGNSVCSSLAH